MFPPPKNKTLEESLSALYESLLRGGDQWSGETGMRDYSEGHTGICLRLRIPLPKDAKPHVASYIKKYLRECGWHVPAVKIRKRYVEIVVSNA